MARRKVYKPRNERYDNVDWARPNRDIAGDLGVTEEAVRQARRRRNINQDGLRVLKSGRVAYERYRDVDWSWSDKDIAYLLDVSPSAVCKARKALGKSKPDVKRGRPVVAKAPRKPGNHLTVVTMPDPAPTDEHGLTVEDYAEGNFDAVPVEDVTLDGEVIGTVYDLRAKITQKPPKLPWWQRVWNWIRS